MIILQFFLVLLGVPVIFSLLLVGIFMWIEMFNYIKRIYREMLE